MGRPRADNSENLPTRLYYKHGAYFYVKKSGQWKNLGRDKEKAIALANIANSNNGELLESREALRIYLQKKVFHSAKQNAKTRGIPFNLTSDDILDLARSNDWRCAVTGIPLSLSPAPGVKRLPYAPSIDRIDNAAGYTLDNCRIVCVSVNIALSDWGDAVLNKIAIYYARQVFERENWQ